MKLAGGNVGSLFARDAARSTGLLLQVAARAEGERRGIQIHLLRATGQI